MPRPRLAVIILTCNEALNLPSALDSVKGWADQIVVLDSGSTDDTIAIARAAGVSVATHPFLNYGNQRNVGLGLVTGAEWVLFLDADERVPSELREEIDEVLSGSPSADGFYVRYRLIWMGRWVRHGYYGSWILRLVRLSAARCEERTVNEHLIVDGNTARLTNDLVHEDRKGIGAWVDKHNRYASWEAAEVLVLRGRGEELPPRIFGAHRQRVRWMRLRVWNRLPPVVRPFMYFLYRYVARGGFLDGRAGLVFHLLHGLWYPLLIDLKYLELRRSTIGGSRPASGGPRRD